MLNGLSPIRRKGITFALRKCITFPIPQPPAPIPAFVCLSQPQNVYYLLIFFFFFSEYTSPHSASYYQTPKHGHDMPVSP